MNENISVGWRDVFHSKVVQRYQQLKQENPSLSIRSLAKMATISSGAMSQILNKNQDWNLTPGRALSILSALGVDEEHSNYIAALSDHEVKIHRSRLRSDDYDILKDWTYLPILVSFDLSERPSVATLAAQLNIEPEKVADVIADLLTRGYLKKSPDGEIYRDKTHWETTDGPPNDAVRMHHRENLRVSQMALDHVAAKDRYFMSMTFAGNREQMDFIKLEIKKLFDKASSMLEQNPPREDIFKMSLSLFPMDFSQKKDGK